MKKLFNLFLKRPDLKEKLMKWPSFCRDQKASVMFNAWMVANMNKPTEFANKFMTRKFLQKLNLL